MKTKPFLKSNKSGVLLLLYLQPGAKKAQIVGEYNGRLKIKILAPPIDGKANESLITYLAELLNTSRSNLEITRGLRSREKDVLVKNLNIEVIAEKMLG